MSQVEPERREHGRIEVGPGGFILPVAGNLELLEEIKRTRPLEPAELLEIAKSYKQYPTNVSLGNHLALIALAMREGGRVMQEAFTEYATNSGWDFVEDLGEILDPDDPDGPEGKKEHLTIHLAIRRVKVSVIELLIETITFQSFPDEETDTGNIIIGISPGPAFEG